MYVRTFAVQLPNHVRTLILMIVSITSLLMYLGGGSVVCSVMWSLSAGLSSQNYGALLESKLIMQTFLYNYFRIATLVARLIDNEVSFDIFSENLLLSARFMACKCFSLPLLSNCNSYHVVN